MVLEHPGQLCPHIRNQKRNPFLHVSYHPLLTKDTGPAAASQSRAMIGNLLPRGNNWVTGTNTHMCYLITIMLLYFLGVRSYKYH